jgi:hypothetical protein
MKQDLYKKLIEYAKKNPHGFIIRIKKGEIRRIYPNKLNYFIASKTRNDTISKIKQSFRDNNFTGYANGWIDKKGNIQIDKNEVFGKNKKEKAISFGLRHNQLVIYDLHGDKDIVIQKKHGEHKAKQVLLKSKQSKIKLPVIRKNKKWFNTITNRYVTNTYAKRINAYFIKHPESTLHEGTGHGKYDRDKSLTEHSKQIRKMAFGKGTQLIKTKTLEGKTVYYSPFLKETASNEFLKHLSKLDYKICGGKAQVELFRMTREKDNIYHLITWDIYQRLESPTMVEFWTPDAWYMYNCMINEIKKIYKKYKFSNITLLYGHVSCYFYSIYDGWEKGTTMGFVIPNRSGYKKMKDDYKNLLNWYRNKLEIDAYHSIMVQRISFYLYDYSKNATDKQKQIAKYRLGINRIMK